MPTDSNATKSHGELQFREGGSRRHIRVHSYNRASGISDFLVGNTKRRSSQTMIKGQGETPEEDKTPNPDAAHQGTPGINTDIPDGAVDPIAPGAESTPQNRP